jgi:ABC-type cobalt transport system substrate-binding protein
MKKLVTMVLTAAMVLSMSVSALANDSASGTVTKGGDDKTNVETITEVTVDDVVINNDSDKKTEEVLADVIKAAKASKTVSTKIDESDEKVVDDATDKVVAPFVEVTAEKESDGKYRPTLENDAIVAKDGKNTRVFGYHLNTVTKVLELVEGTVDTKSHTVKFELSSLSPIALVIVYETVQTTTQTPAQSPATTTTQTTTTQSTPASSPATSPNTGANESAALLCLVAVVAFGAAAVVTMKPRKRA